MGLPFVKAISANRLPLEVESERVDIIEARHATGLHPLRRFKAAFSIPIRVNHPKRQIGRQKAVARVRVQAVR